METNNTFVSAPGQTANVTTLVTVKHSP